MSARNLVSIIAGVALALPLLTGGCKDSKPKPPVAGTAAVQTPAAAAPAAAAGPSGDVATGKVTETMNASTYTYVQVDTPAGKIWAAAPAFEVAVGDEVSVPLSTPMENFHSETLNRTFAVIYFTGGIRKAGAAATNAAAPAALPALPEGHVPVQGVGAGMGTLPAGHPPIGKAATAKSTVEVGQIKKAEGGQTVEEIFQQKSALADKEVVVRGRVVKFAPQILQLNWMHIQDGSGAAGTNDLTVTTLDSAAVGDTVLVHGKLRLDRDFGAGYTYAVIVQEATVAVEPAKP